MKRKHDHATSSVVNRYDITIDYVEQPTKKDKNSNVRLPASFLQNELWMLDKWVLLALQSVIDGSCGDKTRMETDDVNHLNFLVFLDAQGKEYITDIRQMFPQNFDLLVFVSLSINPENFDTLRVHCSSTEKCKELAQYFNILDPLGGGSYPLNYLIVTDSDLVVRCKIPLRIGSHYGPHQRFGVSLSELRALIEEYLEFFTLNHISIAF